MAIGLFYESGGSASGATNQNIHEISAQMSDRNASHVTAPARSQTIILNDSDSDFEGESGRVMFGTSRIVEEVSSTSESESEDPVFACKRQRV